MPATCPYTWRAALLDTARVRLLGAHLPMSDDAGRPRVRADDRPSEGAISAIGIIRAISVVIEPAFFDVDVFRGTGP